MNLRLYDVLKSTADLSYDQSVDISMIARMSSRLAVLDLCIQPAVGTLTTNPSISYMFLLASYVYRLHIASTDTLTL